MYSLKLLAFLSYVCNFCHCVCSCSHLGRWLPLLQRRVLIFRIKSKAVYIWCPSNLFNITYIQCTHSCTDRRCSILVIWQLKETKNISLSVSHPHTNERIRSIAGLKGPGLAWPYRLYYRTNRFISNIFRIVHAIQYLYASNIYNNRPRTVYYLRIVCCIYYMCISICCPQTVRCVYILYDTLICLTQNCLNNSG